MSYQQMREREHWTGDLFANLVEYLNSLEDGINHDEAHYTVKYRYGYLNCIDDVKMWVADTRKKYA